MRPIEKMLKKYSYSGAVRMHMPGHKGKGKSYSAAMDITELSFSDNLLEPKGCICLSQRIFAQRWGAKNAFFSVNGSTAGVLAFFINAKGSVLMQRSSHISAYNAAKLFGKKTYVIDDYDENFMPNSVAKERIANALDEHPDIKTVFLTSPSYYGKVLDIEGISQIAKNAGAKLYIDAAHGAHFGLSPLLPIPAHIYADAAVISVHKTLEAPTQTAVILTNCDQEADDIKKALSLITTTSPSYILMCGIERACALASEKDRYVGLKQLIDDFLHSLPSRIEHIKSDDFTRVVLDISELNISGFEAAKILEEQNVFIEMADSTRLVLISTPADNKRTFKKLKKAIKVLSSHAKTENTMPILKKSGFDNIVELCFNESVKSLPLAQSVGKVAAVNAGFMPPCTPILIQGEVITQKHIELLKQAEQRGISFGIKDGLIIVAD